MSATGRSIPLGDVERNSLCYMELCEKQINNYRKNGAIAFKSTERVTETFSNEEESMARDY